jgi:hypothetical protein
MYQGSYKTPNDWESGYFLRPQGWNDSKATEIICPNIDDRKDLILFAASSRLYFPATEHYLTTLIGNEREVGLSEGAREDEGMRNIAQAIRDMEALQKLPCLGPAVCFWA